ncbi:MAG: ATP synthase subunit I [Candidatus Methylomirabilales bacterium]
MVRKERSLGAIQGTIRGVLLISLGGAGLLLLLGKGDWAWGFFLGFLASLGNFQLMAHAVARIMGPERVTRPKYPWGGSFFRLILLGLFLFLALKFLKADLFALAFGLLLGQVSILGLLVVQGVKAQEET